MLITATASAGGAQSILINYTYLAEVAPGPLVIGHGFAIPGEYSYVDAYSLGTGNTSITTTRDLGSRQVTLVAGSKGTTLMGGGSAYLDKLNAGQSVAILTFVPASRIGFCAASAFGRTGDLDIHVTWGGGSAMMTAAHPDDQGPGLAAASAAGGTSAHDFTVTDGLIGTAIFPHDGVSRISWSSPDGRAGASQAVAAGGSGAAPGSMAFGGPKGKWSLIWTGAMNGQTFENPIVAVWAPIGGAWSYFTK
jgi:hypothetical protein